MLFVNASSGNVGIGTTGPAQALDVNGQFVQVSGSNVNIGLRLKGTESAQKQWLFGASGTAGICGVGNACIRDESAGVTALVIQNTTGNVGIGTTTPTSTLHVSGTGNITNNLIAKRLIIQNPDSTGSLSLIQSSSGSMINETNDGVLTLRAYEYNAVSYSSGSSFFYITNAGNVGIGTTSPQYLLQVADTTGSGLSMNVSDILYVNGSSGNVGIGTTGPTTPLYVKTTGNGGAGVYTATIDNPTQVAANAYGLKIVYSGSSGQWTSGTGGNFINASDDNGANVKFLVTGAGGGYFAGNVGIGTTGPLHKLHVVSDAVRFGDGGTFFLKALTGDTVSTGIRFQIGSGAATDAMFIGGNGNVGIGNTIPNVTLSVSGNANVSGRLSYGTLAANSPHFLETAGQPEPLCIKSAIGKYVGCMVDENFEFNCKIDDKCNRKFLDSRLGEEIEKLSRETENNAQQASAPDIVNISNAGNASNEASANLITGNVINELGLETDLSEILEDQPNLTADNATALNSSDPALPNIDDDQKPDNSSNTSHAEVGNGQVQSSANVDNASNQQISGDGKRLKIEKLSRIRKEIKEKAITVKEAMDELKAEELKYVDINEIQDEFDAAYSAQKASKGSGQAQISTADNLTVSGSVKAAGISSGTIRTSQTNNSFGALNIVEYNSSCAGFRFGAKGGLILSCTQ